MIIMMITSIDQLLTPIAASFFKDLQFCWGLEDRTSPNSSPYYSSISNSLTTLGINPSHIEMLVGSPGEGSEIRKLCERLNVPVSRRYQYGKKKATQLIQTFAKLGIQPGALQSEIFPPTLNFLS